MFKKSSGGPPPTLKEALALPFETQALLLSEINDFRRKKSISTVTSLKDYYNPPADQSDRIYPNIG